MVKKINCKITLDNGDKIPFCVSVVGEMAKDATLDIEYLNKNQYISEEHCLELANMFRAVSDTFLMLYRGQEIDSKIVDIMKKEVIGELED